MTDLLPVSCFHESLFGLDFRWRKAWKESENVGIWEAGGLVEVIGHIICAVEAGQLFQKEGARSLLPIFRHPKLNERQDGELLAIWSAAGSIVYAQGGDYEWRNIYCSYRNLL